MLYSQERRPLGDGRGRGGTFAAQKAMGGWLLGWDVRESSPDVSGLERVWVGGDDAADACRYLVATKARSVLQRKLAGL